MLILVFLEIHIFEVTRVGVKKERQKGEEKLQIFNRRYINGLYYYFD